MIENHESMTAKLCSFVRAHHSLYDRDKIFDDYLAFDLMGSEEYCNIRELIKSGKCGKCESCTTECPYRDKVSRTVHFLAPIPLAREAFTQEVWKGFTKRHPKCQYVICGAGMDSFLFRNEDDDIAVFEVDHPDTQQYKQHRIAELGWSVHGNTTFVSVDFARDDLATRLLESGFDPGRPALFTILGVTYYLSIGALEHTIARMDAISPAGSAVVLDYPDKMDGFAEIPERIARLAQMTEDLGESMTGGFTFDEMQGVFARHHCRIRRHLTPEAIQNGYFRDRKDGLRAYENIHFVHAEKVA